MQFTTKLSLEKLQGSRNIAALLTDNECSSIANEVADGYEQDVSSRGQWETDYAEAMKLALQVSEEKTEPWPGASNVKFPLITIASLHLHARAYPMLVPGYDLVKCRIIGESTPEKVNRAGRVSAFMSYQLMEEDEAWEAEHDKCILVTAIMGCAFKKTYFDALKGHNTSQLVNPKDLVVNYWCKDNVNDAIRATHVYDFTPNQIRERVVSGFYIDFKGVNVKSGDIRQTPLDIAADERQGLAAPNDDNTPTRILEQLCWFDVDGDGYSEPYVATVEYGSSCRLLRLKARYSPKSVKLYGKKVQRITPIKIYTKYELIPAPDGGFYPLGFGRLLGPINDSVNTMLNQVIDAGTMSNYGGGFLGRGARFKGGTNTFKPQEWKQVDSTGDDLRKSLIPLPVREPSRVLVELLMWLVGYGERIASANELQIGENIGQNTPAATAQTMNQNGARIFAAVYKRLWRAFRDELRIQYELDKIFLELSTDFENLTTGEGAIIQKSDFSGPSNDVRPAADPTMVDDATRIAQADFVMGMAFKIPGFQRYLSVLKVLEARKVQDIDKLFPPPQADPQNPLPPGQMPDLPSPPDPAMMKIQIEQGKLEIAKQAQQIAAMNAQINVKKIVTTLQMDYQESQARIMELQARAVKELEESKAVGAGHMVGMAQVELEAEKVRSERTLRLIDAMLGHDQAMTKITSDHVLGAIGHANDATSNAIDAASLASGSGQGGMAATPPNTGVPAAPALGLGGNASQLVQ